MRLLLFASLLIFVRADTIARKAPCFLSAEPGFWTAEGQWVPSDEACSFQNLAGFQTVGRAVPSSSAARILLFGDSNDNKILEDFCLFEAPRVHGTEVFRNCHHDTWSVSYQAMIGVHPTGPYWGGVSGTPSERLAHGLEAFHKEFGADASPDVVVFASNLWDLQRIGSTAQEKFIGHSIEGNELNAYKAHLSAILSQLERTFSGDTLLVFRTGAPGAWGRCRDLALNNWNIHRRHMYQLNAVAKATVLKHPRWHVMDVESFVAEFVCPQDYLRDHAHYNEAVIWAILNMYLNMLKTWSDNITPGFRRNSNVLDVGSNMHAGVA